jgi:hypothetical protein
MYNRFKKNETSAENDDCHIQNGDPPGVNDLAELKTREICRVIYPLNTSGSKQFIISMDFNADFFPRDYYWEAWFVWLSNCCGILQELGQ